VPGAIARGVMPVECLQVCSRTEAADGTYVNDELFGTVQAWSKGWKVMGGVCICDRG